MLCSAKELALADDAEGLLILPADAPVGKIFSEYQPGDTVFEVEITSNRPDLLSYRGLAREIAVTGGGTVDRNGGSGDFVSAGTVRLVGAAGRSGAGPLLHRDAAEGQNRPEPRLAAGGDRGDGPPPDQQRGRHHQFRALRDGPAVARLRRGEAARPRHRGAPRRGRERSSRRSTTRPTSCGPTIWLSRTRRGPWPSPA